MVPMTMPAMAPPERPSLEEELDEPDEPEPEPEPETTTVVVGCWRASRRVRACGRVGVGAILPGWRGRAAGWFVSRLCLAN